MKYRKNAADLQPGTDGLVCTKAHKKQGGLSFVTARTEKNDRDEGASKKRPPACWQEAGLSLPKKSVYGGLFRQKLKKCLRLGAQTPRPPGKAGRYEFILEGLRALQASQKVFLTV